MTGDKASKRLPPSARKLREARSQGRVPRSADLSGWAGLLAASFVIPPLLRFVASRVVGILDDAATAFARPDPSSALRLLSQGLEVTLLGAGAFAGAMALVALVTQSAQGRPVLAWSRLKPDPKRLSPASGARRLFSSTGGIELLKQLVKLALVAVVGGKAVAGLAGVASAGSLVPLGPLLSVTASRLLSLVREIALVGVVIGAADWWWKRREILNELRMTPHEAKEEHRQEEGSPEARTGRRRAALRLYRSRMAGSVEGADVLVTNPTHFAVGLSYRSGEDRAPRVVARGAGEVARRLREDASRLGVPVVEDPPLARAVYQGCLVGEVIPLELYEAVARLLAHVYSPGPPGRRPPRA